MKPGHPALREAGIPEDLDIAIGRHLMWNDEQLAKYRTDWCRQWLRRASELESAERVNRSSRPLHVQANAGNKRVLLTREILESIQYEDPEALKILQVGATLAGEIEKSSVFEHQFKPCLMTVKQLEAGAVKRNQAILAMTTSTGDLELDQQLLHETQEELAKGWARGPFRLEDLPEGAVLSRRFALVQSTKTRMIDDFSISGVNDSCVIHGRISLRMINTLGAVIRKFLRCCREKSQASTMLAKTFDLKSAYRQVPIREARLKYAFFSVYNNNLLKGKVDIYQLLTLPFGATHSVYCFLRLARMIHCIACRGLYLMNTNFYDDFVLMTRPGCEKSAKNSMELLFMLTGWSYARDGKKATEFSTVCRALGVEFDFSRSEQRIVAISNTAQRKQDLILSLTSIIEAGKMTKQEALVLRGRLGFADSFLHGRLGKLVLKKVVDRAYSRQKKLDLETTQALLAIRSRLEIGKPALVTDEDTSQWFVYTDAAFNLDDVSGQCVEWFGFALDHLECECFGARCKETIIHELELAAAVLALAHWQAILCENLTVWFGDNDGVRFASVRASATGIWAEALMSYHLEAEASSGTRAWFAGVPTEANVSDFPSRLTPHPFLTEDKEATLAARAAFGKLLAFVRKHVGLHERERGDEARFTPRAKKRAAL